MKKYLTYSPLKYDYISVFFQNKNTTIILNLCGLSFYKFLDYLFLHSPSLLTSKSPNYYPSSCFPPKLWHFYVIYSFMALSKILTPVASAKYFPLEIASDFSILTFPLKIVF